MSCCWLGVSCWSKIASTVVASPPLLSCASIAQSRSLQRPSWRKKMRWPRPHKGAVRNWSPPAPPWETLSANTVPMWWISMSENKLAVALPNPGVKLEGWVASDGVWQVAQPIALKSLRPLAIEVAPPGEVVEGVGWSRNCMNATNSPTSLVTVEALVPPEWVMSSG